MLRHVLYPSYHGSRVSLVVCVHEVGAGVLCWIVRHETLRYHRIHSLPAVNSNGALTLLVLSYHHVHGLSIALQNNLCLTVGWVCLRFHVPYLAVIDGIVVNEGNLPITSLLVSPI